MRFKVVVSDRFSIGFVQENQRTQGQRKRRIFCGNQDLRCRHPTA
jgi:hypothetical protein